MSIFEQLSGLGLDGETTVTLSYSDGVDVFVHNETAVDTAISETDVIYQFASLGATPRLMAEVPYVGRVIETLRDDGYLDDYERDSTFGDYIAEVLTENFYEQEFIDKSIERYDYKRGYCTLETTVQVPLSNFIEARPQVTGWSIEVPTENGKLVIG